MRPVVQVMQLVGHQHALRTREMTHSQMARSQRCKNEQKRYDLAQSVGIIILLRPYDMDSQYNTALSLIRSE